MNLIKLCHYFCRVSVIASCLFDDLKLGIFSSIIIVFSITWNKNKYDLHKHRIWVFDIYSQYWFEKLKLLYVLFSHYEMLHRERTIFVAHAIVFWCTELEPLRSSVLGRHGKTIVFFLSCWYHISLVVSVILASHWSDAFVILISHYSCTLCHTNITLLLIQLILPPHNKWSVISLAKLCLLNM